MKKILILLLTAAMSFMFSAAVNGEESYSYKYGEEQLAKYITEELDILSYSEETADDTVSRMDFALYLARLLKIDEYAKSDKCYFTDVDINHYGCTALNALTEMGITDRNSAGKFNPDDYITRAEISKMLLSALGYKPYAEASGGYPTGYLQLAAKSKIFNGTETDKDVFTVREVAVILTNAASVAMYTPQKYSSGVIEYAVDNETTLFSRYFNIYAEFGILNSVGNVSITDKTAGSGRVMVGNSVYLTNKNYEDNLGEEVYAYYYSDASDEERKLFCLRTSDKQKIIRLSTEEFSAYTDNVFSYYSDSGKLLRCRTDNSTVFIKNGVQILYDVENEVKTDFGFYKLTDSDENGVYETVIIEDTETITVGAADNSSGIIYDKSSKHEPISFDEYSSGTLEVYDINGTVISFDDIVPDDILSVVRSKGKYLKIRVSKKTETVVVKSTENNGHIILNTDDKSYEVADSFADYELQVYRNSSGKLDERFDLGMSYELRMDVYSRVAYISPVKNADEYIIGYIITAGIGDDGFGNMVLKLLCEDKSINSFDCADKVKIDEVTYSSAQKAYNIISNADKVIRFKINENNEIFDIDTSEYNSAKESENTLRCTREYDKTAESLTYVSSTHLFGATMYADSDTLIINLPMTVDGISDGEYSFGTLDCFMDSTAYNIEAYKIGVQAGAEDVIVYRPKLSEVEELIGRSNSIIVDKVSEILNSDGMCVKNISGYQLGAYVTFAVTDNFNEKTAIKNYAGEEELTLEDIKKGDIIKIGKNSRNEITRIQYYLDGKNQDAVKWGPVYGNFIDRGRQELAYCIRKNGSVIEWSYTPDGDIAGVYDLGTAKVVLYDANNKRAPFAVGTVNDIVSYEMAGDACSRLYIGTYVSKIRTVVVYK